MTEQTEIQEKVLGRIFDFSDGIFAFAITLLILNVAVLDGTSNEDLSASLAGLWPKYLSFLLSFLVIGLFWIVHVRQFRILKKYDTTIMWLNLLLLMFIVIIPFSTSVLSDFTGRLPTILYAVNVACAGFILSGTWIYATYKHKLVSDDLSQGFIRQSLMLRLVTPVIFTLSIGIAFFDTTIAQYAWIATFVLHFVLSRVFKIPSEG